MKRTHNPELLNGKRAVGWVLEAGMWSAFIWNYVLNISSWKLFFLKHIDWGTVLKVIRKYFRLTSFWLKELFHFTVYRFDTSLARDRIWLRFQIHFRPKVFPLNFSFFTFTMTRRSSFNTADGKHPPMALLYCLMPSLIYIFHIQ